MWNLWKLCPLILETEKMLNRKKCSIAAQSFEQFTTKCKKKYTNKYLSLRDNMRFVVITCMNYEVRAIAVIARTYSKNIAALPVDRL